MALFARAGRRLVKLNATTGPIWRVSTATLHLGRVKRGEYDYVPPEGYDKTQLKKGDRPEFIDQSKLMSPRERAERASKYNLIPEDYVPMEGYGDYPKLPNEAAFERDPYYDWDQPALRRNYGEPIHVHQEVYDQFSALDRRPLMLDRRHYTRFLLTLAGTLIVLIIIGGRFPRFAPVAPIQYPEEFPQDDKAGTNVGRDWWYTEFKSKEVVNYDFK
uniref:NADH dehydrogenase [ubiquinone] 1 beta subcomplex subunit 8, mitochondrial-like n=1 Tax=Styela clava TaxID=7725 RepID=UPI001939DDD6|nr:NADH dehydrogenase [ubiquinone] 1 beta subcomplex subunit 8, mitochondrial-like [Styela clava]